MKRFYHQHSFSWIKHVIALGIFVLIFCSFIYGISGISDKTSSEEAKNLELAISRGIAHCYASEGRYPEDLDYLKEHYGISYDSDEYFVDYQVLGQNIFPDVTIIKK